jgi:hypothetical protein
VDPLWERESAGSAVTRTLFAMARPLQRSDAPLPQECLLRPAVLAAVLAFDSRLAWTRRPVRLVGRRLGGMVMRWLDRRRQLVDG